jgi:HTH-type transcriptional regulator/antitoxin HigA
MEIRPVKTETEHEEALKAIEKLFDATPGSPEADQLEVLAMLVKAYEDVHEPIAPPDPITAIEFRME